MKIITRPDDPTRHYTCMKAAAEAGLAPHVWYTGMLHALPPFPAVDGFIQRFQAANILPKAESEELSARYAQRTAVYPHQDPDMVSSHNDSFKPDNILFDGHRVWLVDWEAAFLNEQFADLAVVANLVVTNEAEEKIYLQEYFGEPPDQYQLARFFLMQQVAQIFYGMVFLLLGSSGKPIDWSETVPEFRDFHRRIWAGEINLADSHMKMSVAGFIGNSSYRTRSKHDNEALRIVLDWRATV